MAVYSELIKNFEKVREYVRDFYIFGFHTRESFDAKSKRTYDNEKRRIESWLSDHVHTSLEGHKKKVSVQVDSGNIFQNPLYQCYRSKTFTDNDIRLHFILMDALEDNAMSVSEIADYISANYGMIIDVQIIRIKLKEYVKEGLVSEVKSGRNILYTSLDARGGRKHGNHGNAAAEYGRHGAGFRFRQSQPEHGRKRRTDDTLRHRREPCGCHHRLPRSKRPVWFD